MKNIRSFSLIFFAFTLILFVDSCKKNNEELGPYNKVRTAAGFKELIEKQGDQVQILDFRSETEFAKGHIAGATNIPATLVNTASDGSFGKTVLATFDKTKPLLIYGNKNSVDLEYIVPGRISKIGFKKDNTYALLGGYEAWVDAFPSEIVK